MKFRCEFSDEDEYVQHHWGIIILLAVIAIELAVIIF